MLIEISGHVYNDTLFSKGGKGYFYPNMTSLIGVCIPKTCKVNEFQFLKDYLRKEVMLNGFIGTDLNIEFTIQKGIEDFQINKMTIFFALIVISMVSISYVIFFGTFIEMT